MCGMSRVAYKPYSCYGNYVVIYVARYFGIDDPVVPVEARRCDTPKAYHTKFKVMEAQAYPPTCCFACRLSRARLKQST